MYFDHSGGFVEFPIEDVETSIPAQFEKIAQQYPDYSAIKIGDQVVTYAELNAMANRIAWSILGLTGNDRAAIALHLETGLPLLATLFGVLKAGKIFVFLDPLFPPSRIESIIQNAQVELVITDQYDKWNAEFTRMRCRAARHTDLINNTNSENLPIAVAPESFATIV